MSGIKTKTTIKIQELGKVLANSGECGNEINPQSGAAISQQEIGNIKDRPLQTDKVFDEGDFTARESNAKYLGVPSIQGPSNGDNLASKVLWW